MRETLNTTFKLSPADAESTAQRRRALARISCPGRSEGVDPLAGVSQVIHIDIMMQ
jgi:hypothetical protein